MPSANPLWFGYYPGDRPVKKGPDKRFPTPQLDMSDVGLSPAIDEAARIVEMPAEMPSTVWSWVVEDWKQKFVVYGNPGPPSGSDLYAFPDEEVTDVKGVNIPVNLWDAATNPSKTLKKFVDSSLGPVLPFGTGKDVFSSEFWTDLDTVVERQMWRDIVRDEKPDNVMSRALHDQLVDNQATGTKGVLGRINFSNQRVFADTEMYDLASKANITVSGASGLDVYQAAGESVLNFVAKKKSVFTRQDAYSGMQESFIKAAATELSQEKTTIDTLLAGSVKSMAVSTKIDGFIQESVLVENMGKMGDALKDLQKEFAKSGLTGKVTVKDMQTHLISLGSAADRVILDIGNVRSKYKGDDLVKFNHDVNALQEYAFEMQRFSKALDGRNPLDFIDKMGEGEALVTRATTYATQFSNGRYGGGVSERYLKSVSARGFEGPDSLLQLHFVDPTTGDSLLSDGFYSMDTVYHLQKRIYLQEEGRDILGVISKGDFAKNYIWVGQIKDRVQVYTPGYWTNKVMSRTRGFGLVYDPKVTNAYAVFEKSPLIREHHFTEKFDVTKGGAKVEVAVHLKGGRDLGSFYEAWSRASESHLVGSVSSSGAMAWRSADENWQSYFALLNGTPSGFKYWLGEGESATKHWDRLTKGGKNFTKDLDAQLKKYGLSLKRDSSGNVIDSLENREILNGLFTEVSIRKKNAANLNPFQDKFGVLQIYTSKLSLIQQKVYTTLKLNKLMDPFVRFKTVLAQKIAAMAAKLAVRAGLAAATGGLATVLMPIVEKLLQAGIAKLTDAVKELAKSLLKGNFSEALDDLMNSAMKATEKVLMFGCIVPLILAFGVFMMLGNVLLSISPLDRSKTPSSTGAGSSSVPPPVTTTGSGKFFKDGCNENNLLCGAFKNGAGCHGTNKYWNTNVLKDQCAYNIPISSFGNHLSYGTSSIDYKNLDPANPNPYCSINRPHPPFGGLTTNNTTKFYGYAADFHPKGGSCSGADMNIAYTPTLAGVDKWKVVGVYDALKSEPRGCGVTLDGEDSSGAPVAKMIMLHLAYTGAGRNCSGYTMGKVYTPGQSIGNLFISGGSWDPHVHIELKIGTSVVEPDNRF